MRARCAVAHHARRAKGDGGEAARGEHVVGGVAFDLARVAGADVADDAQRRGVELGDDGVVVADVDGEAR